MMKESAQDVIDYFDLAIRTSRGYDKQLKAATRKMGRILNVPLSEIPCDLEFFERRWPRRPTFAVSSHWSSLKAYERWRHFARKAMKLFQRRNDPPETVIVDGWTPIIETVVRLYGALAAIPVKSLARECRRLGLMPQDMDGRRLNEVLRSCARAATAKSVKTGWKRLESMKDQFSCPVPSDFSLDEYKRRNIAWRRPMPEDLASLTDAWVARKIRGEGIGFEDLCEDGVSQETAYSIRDSIAYFYTAAVTLHPDFQHKPGFDILRNFDVIVKVVTAEKNGTLPWKPLAPVTVLNRLRFLRAFLEGNSVDDATLRRLEKLIDADYFSGTKQMSASRQQWCHKLMQDPALKKTYLDLPGTLWEVAKAKLSSYDSASGHDRTRILNAGTAACLGAIWGSLPLRIKNTSSLTVGGDAPDVRVTGSTVLISTRAVVVKNEYEHVDVPLATKSGVNPAVIVRWYCEQIRPRLLADDKFCAEADLLFCGMDRFRLRLIWKRASLAQNIPMTPHFNRNAQATLLLNDAGLPMNVIAAHLGTSVDVAERNYAFVVKSKQHRAAQAALASLSSGEPR